MREFRQEVEEIRQKCMYCHFNFSRSFALKFYKGVALFASHISELKNWDTKMSNTLLISESMFC